MNSNKKKATSKFLSLVLRHDPDAANIELDNEGWADVNKLMPVLRMRNLASTIMELEEVVRDNDKQRFTISKDFKKIRANQGHSVKVDLGLEPVTPPDVLYHGTIPQFIDSILANGLMKGSRHHVHLSTNTETAKKVGQRRGKPVILIVDAKKMHEAGHKFFVSANGVWLTDHVPAEFLTR